MKVLHINSYYNGSVFYKKFYDHQLENDIDIDVFVPVPSTYLDSKFDYGVYTKVSKNHYKFDRYLFHLKHFKIYKDINRLYNVNDYTIIHSHSLFSNGYIAMKLKKEYGIPYLVAVRNTDVNVFFKRMIFLRKIGIDILKNADRVIFLSKSYRDKVIQNYIPENLKPAILNKISIIPNGIDDFWFESIWNKKTLPIEEDLKLLYVGSVNKNKNITTTTKAIDLLLKEGIKAKLTVVGRIEDQSIYNQIKTLDFVEYIEPKPKEDLLKIYRQNDIFVMPSIHESFGLVYAEAMSQGLPIIYTKGQGFDGQFEDGLVGYGVNCTDIYEIVKKIKLIIADYKTLSNNCIKSVEKFKWRNISLDYKHLYHSIISGEI